MAPISKFKILGNFRHRNILRIVDVSNVFFFLGCWLGFWVWCVRVRMGVGGLGVGVSWLQRVSIWFWVDDWLGKGALSLSFPRLFRVVSNRDSSVKEGYVGEVGCVLRYVL